MQGFPLHYPYFIKKMSHTQSAVSSDDPAIIEKVIAGDVNAFELLLHRYESLVLHIVRRHLPPDDAEEKVQDIFIRAYESLPQFKKKSSFKNWLAAIAVRSCYDYWREKYKKREVLFSTLSEAQQERIERLLSETAGQNYEEAAQKKEAGELLDWALAHLSAEERMVLELVHLEGLSGKEAAGMLGWSVANVKVRSFRARNKLKKLLTVHFHGNV